MGANDVLCECISAIRLSLICGGLRYLAYCLPSLGYALSHISYGPAQKIWDSSHSPPYSDFVILRIRYTYLLSRRRFRWVQWPGSLGYSMELSRNDTRVFLDLCPPKRPVQRRRRMDSSRSARLPYVLFNRRAGVYGLVGV